MKNVTIKLAFVAAFLLTALMMVPAQASLIGTDVRHRCPQCGPAFDQTFTVLEGMPEITPFDQYEIDVEAESIRVTWITSINLIDPLDFLFEELTWGNTPGEIIDATVNLSSTGDFNFVAFGPDSVQLNLNGVGSVTTGEFVLIDLVVNHNVPEPVTLALMGLGLLGLGFRQRKKV